MKQDKNTVEICDGSKLIGYNMTLKKEEYLQMQKDYQIRKVVEMRLDMAKTLKDDYMIQLFTDILRGR